MNPYGVCPESTKVRHKRRHFGTSRYKSKLLVLLSYPRGRRKVSCQWEGEHFVVCQIAFHLSKHFFGNICVHGPHRQYSVFWRHHCWPEGGQGDEDARAQQAQGHSEAALLLSKPPLCYWRSGKAHTAVSLGQCRTGHARDKLLPSSKVSPGLCLSRGVHLNLSCAEDRRKDASWKRGAEKAKVQGGYCIQSGRVVWGRQCCVHGEHEIKNKTNVRCKTIVRQ